MPSGPSSHFHAATAYASTAQLLHGHRDRAGGLRPVDDDDRPRGPCASSPIRRIGSTAPVVHRTWLARIARAGRSSAAANAATTALARPPSPPSPPTSTNSTSTPCRSRNREQRPEPARALVARRQHAVARPPGDRVEPQVEPVDSSLWVSATSSAPATSTAATAARASPTAPGSRAQVGLPAADRQLTLRLLVHRALGLGRHRPRGPGVEVDPGARGGQQRPDSGHLGRLRHERGDHVRIISTPPARTVTPPLGGSPGRFRPPRAHRHARNGSPRTSAASDLRVIDVRWRPDGSAADPLRHRPHPGRRPPRLADSSVVDAAETGDALLLLAAPDHMAAVMSGPASGTARPSCCTTTRCPTSRRASGGACAPTATSRRGSSRRASPPGSRPGNAVVNGSGRRPRRRRSRRARRHASA